MRVQMLMSEAGKAPEAISEISFSAAMKVTLFHSGE